ncbi:ABC transporter permease [Lacticaseibacillus sharpeae]|uniref:Oligopeptide transport system permease protein AmiC n=1 Tax=Lacticaseibacillus sharpeae JCM 1186 = DSM 20505 TaxID=1291052 RepID=A0A0R1ZL73_9LACO|nr:ABC transporter permease [Lacticaseibacillus sharpeae]KRM55146.1 oligopeptide transport system permease protein AmiC [Lacticaseibacillus sharpeae JCM 1186 = DSM 20505]
MKKYVFFRVLRSIVSIFLVTTATFIIIYSLVPRRDVFKEDPNVNKLQSSPDKLTEYENNAFEKMNYLDYLNTRDLMTKVEKANPKATITTAHTEANRKAFAAWTSKHGYELKKFKQSKDYYAVRELPLWERLSRFYGGLIKVDNPWAIHDKKNPNLKRYLKIEHDETVGWALVGSGTKYRYQIYFNGSFPYIHQNIIKFNLGTSYPTYANLPVSSVIGGGQGEAKSVTFTGEDGKTVNNSDDVYTRQYQTPSKQDSSKKAIYQDDYTDTDQSYQDPSMIGTSVRAGLVGILIQYLLAIPFGIFMARYKNRLFDRIGTGVITLFIAVPSLAFIYVFRFIGQAVFQLPDSFPTNGASAISSWVMPSVILGLLMVSGLALWFRRFMIDQQSSDYVKFAKAKGLNENEIYTKHIFKNASIPIVNGIPGSIIATIGGATMTEEIFAMPGMGKMLPDSITAHNNSVVIGLVFIFTTIAVLSVLLGDLLMAAVDPRIKLSASGDD